MPLKSSLCKIGKFIQYLGMKKKKKKNMLCVCSMNIRCDVFVYYVLIRVQVHVRGFANLGLLS